MQFDVSDTELVYTSEGLKPLKELMLHANFLWAIPWNDGNKKAGITFHCKYKDAIKYAKSYTSCKASDHPRLVPVSEWIYDWVSANGDLWTPLNYLAEAPEYTPTIH